MEVQIGLAIAIAGAGMAALVAGIGSAVGIGYTAQAAAGVLRVEPEKFGRLFLLVALPGTQGFYGFIAGFLVILKLGLLGENVIRPGIWEGGQIFLACIPVAFAGLVSAIYQGKVCTAGIHLVAKQPEHSMKGVIYGALVETYAILGLLITFFLLNGIRLQG